MSPMAHDESFISHSVEGQEQALHLIEAIWENVSAGLVVLDVQWRFTYLNRYAAKLLGRTRQELLGKNVWDEYPAYVGSVCYEKWHESIKKQLSLECEMETLQDQKHCRFQTYPTSEGLVVYFTDITEEVTLRQHYEECKRTLERLKAALEEANIGTFTWNMPAGEVNMDSVQKKLLGLPSNIFGAGFETWMASLHPDDRPTILKSLVDSFNMGGIKNEFRIIWPDGSVHWILASAHVFCNASGEPLGALGVNVDVTDRRRAEEQLRQSEERYRIVLEAVNDIVCTLDTQGRLTYVSPSLYQQLGYVPEDVLGLHLSKFCHPDDIPLLQKELNVLLGGEQTQFTFRWRHKGGHWLTLVGGGKAALNENNQPTMVVCAFHEQCAKS